MAIYTKTGDKGETKVFDKKTGKLTKISKTSCKIASIGAVDELNSFLGVVRAELQSYRGAELQRETERKILEIQGNLFTINSILAGGKLRFSKVKTKKLEKEIDKWEGKLPVLKNFIYYGGSADSSLIFYARALCRRAERSLVSMHDSSFMIPDSILIYMNRLSDYLFMLARARNFELGGKEKAWRR